MTGSAKRAIVNTLAQHIRAIVNICLSLYSTRLVLEALGQSDYGIYSLVAGVVAMLGFITNALVVTTQRYLSFYHGRNDANYLKKIFTNSLFLHILFATLICGVLLSITTPMMHSWLLIEPDRQSAATIVYFLTIIMLFFTIMAAPFKSLFIARENIVYISIIEVCDGILKLVLAIYLLYANHDKLILYAMIMTFIQCFTFVAFVIYGKLKYQECRLAIHIRDIEKQCMKSLLSFAGWTIYSTGCIVGRTQGFAIVLNRFFGIIYNASYGIAQQVSGAIFFLSQAVINAMSPQVVKAEGSNDRETMILRSENLCKYSFLILSMVGIPLMFEMNEILSIWLGTIPDAAISFCRFILLAAILDQTTVGLGTAIQATGRIKWYSLIISTLKLVTIPAMCLALYLGTDVHTTLWLYVIFEVICGIGKIPFAVHITGLKVSHFLKNVIYPIILPTLTVSLLSWGIKTAFSFDFRFLLSLSVAVVADCLVIWYFILSSQERSLIAGYVRQKFPRFHQS